MRTIYACLREIRIGGSNETMPRKPIFDRAMTTAERQRRHREKKRAEQASPDQLMEGLQPFDIDDFVRFDLADFISLKAPT